jgi:A/G-specific adenine glycosylase
MSSRTAQRRKIVPVVLRWYRRYGRKLPWRGVRDPYRILLSEIMLQQTQVSRVREIYPRFLRRFPSFEAVARSPVREVTVAWRGMGYNNRAIRFHSLSTLLVNHYGGRLPADAQSLMELPGVGRYTAHAILSSVHRLPVPIVEVNVRRVFSRVFHPMASTAALQDEAEIWRIAGALLPQKQAYDWNQAVMDLGATVCTASQPACERCPLARRCASRKSMVRLRSRARRTEPGLDGVPNRIYRGRIIEELRQDHGRRTISMSRLGRRIYPAFSAQHASWLLSLLKALEKDGLITMRSNGRRRSERVSLA